MPRGPNTGIGNYGGLPYKALLDKNEVTEMFEDDEQVNYHIRDLIRDYTPDNPLFDEDQPRAGNIDPKTGHRRNGGTYSKARLQLRQSGQWGSGDQPFLPDGTFLDFQGLEKDPRSLMNQPDMTLARTQAQERGKFINFYPDASPFTIDGGNTPFRNVQNQKAAQRWAKDRLKVFSTGKDNWVGHKAGQTLDVQSKKVQVTTDGEVLNLSDAQNTQRTNLTALFTNKRNVGWRQTPDQEFRVAKYGAWNSQPNIQNQKWYKNMREGMATPADNNTVWRDQRVLAGMVPTLERLIGERNTRKKVVNDTPWQSSFGLEKPYSGLKPSNIGAKIDNSVESRSAEVVRLLQDKFMQHNPGYTLPKDPSSKKNLTWVNLPVIQFLENVNKKLGPEKATLGLKDATKLAQALTDRNEDEFSTYKSLDPAMTDPVSSNWNSRDFRVKEDGKLAANYTQLRPNPAPALEKLVNQDQPKYLSKDTIQYSSLVPDAQMNILDGYLSQDQIFEDNPVGFTNGAPMGNKDNVRRAMSTSQDLDDEKESMSTKW